MCDKDPWPELLLVMDKLGYRVQPWPHSRIEGVDLYLVDLSSLKLSLSDRTPFFLIRANLLNNLSTYALYESLKDIARGQSWLERDCILLLEKNDSSLKNLVSGKYNPCFVVLDFESQQTILELGSPLVRLLDQICSQIPISSLAPYKIGGTVIGNQFFGREREINRIMRKQDTNFAIVGVRRIGKSSLIQEIKQRILHQAMDLPVLPMIDNMPGKPLVWRDASTMSEPREFLRQMVADLNVREMFKLEKRDRYFFEVFGFLKRMSKMYNQRITIFLDEADNFLDWVKLEPDLLPSLRASTAEGYCRYIFAGFKGLLGELSNMNSPFYNAFEPLILGPFRKDETEEAVLRPMKSLRLRIENEGDIVNRIHEDTGGHPLLVQTYCRELISQMEADSSRILSPDLLKNVYSSQVLRIQMINSFRDNVEKEDKLLVYSTLLSFPDGKKVFSKADISTALNNLNCPSLNDDIEKTCERLVFAGIFTRQEKQYAFAVPMFSRVIRLNQNIEYEIKVTKKELGLC
jgi:hypothetical protein